MDFYLTGEVVSLVDVCILGGLELWGVRQQNGILTFFVILSHAVIRNAGQEPRRAESRRQVPRRSSRNCSRPKPPPLTPLCLVMT